MSRYTDPGRLPCGRSWDDLVDQVADGGSAAADDHQRSCPHCQAALAEIGRLWAPVATLAAEPVRAPDALTSRVMQHVRQVARQQWHSLLAGDQGSTWVAARVVAVIARLAADRVPGVAVALGRSTQTGDAERRAEDTRRHRAPGAAVGVAGGTAVIELALTAEYGTDLRDVAARVRREVVADVTALAGLEEVLVDVHVDDVTG